MLEDSSAVPVVEIPKMLERFAFFFALLSTSPLWLSIGCYIPQFQQGYPKKYVQDNAIPYRKQVFCSVQFSGVHRMKVYRFSEEKNDANTSCSSIPITATYRRYTNSQFAELTQKSSKELELHPKSWTEKI